jgi:hypothetical protein
MGHEQLDQVAVDDGPRSRGQQPRGFCDEQPPCPWSLNQQAYCDGPRQTIHYKCGYRELVLDLAAGGQWLSNSMDQVLDTRALTSQG